MLERDVVIVVCGGIDGAVVEVLDLDFGLGGGRAVEGRTGRGAVQLTGRGGGGQGDAVESIVAVGEDQSVARGLLGEPEVDQ